jgi:hypothetical protein
MAETKKSVMTLVMGKGLKKALEKTSKGLGCSQGEVIRTALYGFLNDVIEKQLAEDLVLEKSEEEAERLHEGAESKQLKRF